MSLSLGSEELEKLKKKIGYKGCRNCVFQPEPLCMCDWRKQDIHLHLICPKWVKNNERL